MAITDVQICNLAFNKLGHEGVITSIGEDSTEGALTLRYYEYVRDTLLSEHTWNFCVSRATLSRDATNPDFEFSYQYLLPANFVRPIALYDSNEPYKIEVKSDGTKRLLTDETVVNLIYVLKQEDVSQFSPQFVDALICRLAAEMAQVISHDSGKSQALFAESELKLKKAKRTDGMSGTPGRIKTKGFSSWKRSQLSGIKPDKTY